MVLSPDVAQLGWVRAYPDLFAQLDDRSAWALHNAIANNVHAGWRPTRADISDQVDVMLGRITDEELHARTLARISPAVDSAKRHATGETATPSPRWPGRS
ncbi:MAG: hypothetical protein INR66_17930 [Gordonia polyisoprenivorans]|nr:hypothetical protein [Gordonia polyisoprenivorans]